MSVPRSRNVVKVAFQKDQPGASKSGGPSSATNTFEARAEDVGDGPALTSRALGAGKKSRPNLHPSLSTDSLSSITDNIEKNGNRDTEEDGLGSGISTPVRKLANLTIIRPPKLKQLKNLQQLLLQYQQQYYSLKQQKVSESRSNSPLPIPGNTGKSTASQTPFLYVIDAIWLRKWLHYITTEQSSSVMNDKADSRCGSPTFNGEESHAPGPITNWNLVEEQPNGEEVPLTVWKNQRVSTSSKEYINGHYKLKPDLQEGQDYYLLPVEAWNAVYNWYSGGPPLPRFLFNVLQVYVTDDYYPLSTSLMELFFITPSQSLEKKVIASNEITTLTKEKILEYYQEVEEEGLNSPQKRKIQGIADEKKLLLADLYPPNSDNIPCVKDTHDFLGITIAPTTPMALSPTRFHHSHHNTSNGTDVTAEQQKKFFPLMNAFEAIPEEDLSKSVENSPVPTVTKNLPRPAPTATTNTTVPPPPPPTSNTTTSKDSNGSTSTESNSTANKNVPVVINHCAVCGDLAKTRCGQCSFLFYCTKECQKIHWKYHKTSCKTIKERSLALQSKGAVLKKEDLNVKDQALIYGKQGKVGLHNLGNSCYMNSSLQCLIHIIPLTKYLLSGRYLNDINVSNRDGTKGELVKVYATLIQDIYLDNKAVIAPSLLKKVLGNINDEYAGFNQQDAHEVIELLLDKLHEDINRIITKPYTMKLEGDGSNDIMIARDTWNRHLLRHSSYIQELFGCLMRSQLTCPTCSKISVSYEYHNTIQVAIPRNYNITITILFIPEIPSSKYESNDGNVEINLRTISSQWSNFLPKKVTLTVDRYTSIKSLKKQLLLHLTSFQRSIYNESNIFFFESMNPSKRVENNIKYIKYLKDIILINSLSSSNTILLAYGMTLASLSSHHFLFIHMRTMEILESPNNNDDDAEDDVSIHYTGYPLLLSYDRTSWSCQRTRHHIWLNTIRYFQPSSTYVKESLEYLTTSNIMKQMEISQHFPIRLISNDGGPMMSVDHKRLLALAKKKKGNGVFPPPPMDDLDLSFGSILPSDRSLMIEEFTGDIERLYPSGAIYFSLDVIVEAKPIIDYQHLKSLDAVITTRSAAVASSLSSSPTNNKNGNNNNHNILTLDDCLKEYTKEEILEVGNEWYCNKCQEHKQAYKIMQFHYSYLPNILILTLKRFEYRDISSLMGGGYNSNNMIHREKIDHFIDFPIYGLNLKKYCTGITAGSTSTKKSSTEESGVTEMQKEVISNEDEGKKEMKKEGEEVKKEDGKNNDEDDDEEENDAIYDLFAICNHYGRMGFGHYTAYVKDWALYEEATQTTVPNKPPSTGGWYLYDDNSVVKVSEKEIKTSSAYILFYRKRNLHY